MPTNNVSRNKMDNTQQASSNAKERVIDSKDLLQGSKTLLITHDGHEYRLQITRSSKLLLTK